MLDHMTLGVEDIMRSVAFFSSALAPLGIKQVDQTEQDDTLHAVGFGASYPIFWIHRAQPLVVKVHAAFVATSTDEVDAFHQAALAAGGSDHGAPGLRSHKGYPKGYYAAFVLDPDGNNIEAVFRNAPED